MKGLLGKILVISSAIIATGVVLDEAGKGTFGSAVQSAASKVTRGYGV